jgi:putative PIN family toxin of toxin-antitoxin system
VIRVVLDTNVLASGFSTQKRTTSAAILLDLWSQQVFELVVSEHLLRELTDTLAETYFSKLFLPGDVDKLLANLRLQAFITDLTQVVSDIASHPEDDLILSTGLSAGASFLATRDRQLLKLGSCQGMQILHPADLVDVLLQEPDPLT